MTVAIHPHCPPVWMLLQRAVLDKQAVRLRYHGHDRIVCPHALGSNNGQLVTLVYQWASPLIVEAPFKLPVPGWPRRSRSRRATSNRRRCDVCGYYRSRTPTIQLFSSLLLSS